MEPPVPEVRAEAGREARRLRPAPASRQPLLALAGVSKRWPRQGVVLEAADLELVPRQVAWLGGPNGVGKTTLLRIAAGLIEPDRGTVELCGRRPRGGTTFQRRLGFLPAGDRGLYARLTVERNIRFWSKLAYVPRRERDAAVGAALERFGLEALADRRVDRLSLGQRQRVRLAMTFLHEPVVVLLDEPHTSLDEAGIALLASALGRLVAGGGAALWCAPSPTMADLPHDSSYRIEERRVVPA